MTKVVFSSELDESDISVFFGDISDNLHDKSDISTKIFDKRVKKARIFTSKIV